MKNVLFILLFTPFVLIADNSEDQEFCLELHPNDSSRFVDCLENVKNYKENLPKPEVQKTYNGWLMSRYYGHGRDPIPNAHIINDPNTNYCSVYYKNGEKQFPYKGRNLGSYNRIVCGGETLDDAINYCMSICEGKITKAQAQKEAQINQQMVLWNGYIDQKKAVCMSYGFKEENAIAGCVQTEINNEVLRQQQVQTYANAQARSNAIQRNNALSNMGACLQTEGSFGACANAWQGYTPKKVVKCSFDAFGNKITSTCREQ
jgi:hypothetical protein